MKHKNHHAAHSADDLAYMLWKLGAVSVLTYSNFQHYDFADDYGGYYEET